MSADIQMLSFFAREALDACGKIDAAKAAGDCAAAVAAAKSLRSAAKMLGFDTYAKVAEKLEGAFSENFAAASENHHALAALGMLRECAESSPETLAETVEQCQVVFEEFCGEDFTASEAGTAGANPPDPHPEKPQKKEKKSASAKKASAVSPTDPLFDVFMEDATTRSAEISDGLLKMERNPREAPTVDSLLRASHSLKGAARIAGIEWLVNFAHRMEDCFSAVRDAKIEPDSDFFDLLFECSDFISAAVASRFSGVDISAAGGLSDDMSALLNGKYKPAAKSAKAFSSPARADSAKPQTSVKVAAKSLNSLWSSPQKASSKTGESSRTARL